MEFIKYKKNHSKFPIPPTRGTFPITDAIWKTLHAASKVNVMKKKKKNEKGHLKNKFDVINIGK